MLEAENAAEVFKGIAKEMMSKLQIAQFSLTSSTQLEDELKSKLRVAQDELRDTKTLLRVLELKERPIKLRSRTPETNTTTPDSPSRQNSRKNSDLLEASCKNSDLELLRTQLVVGLRFGSGGSGGGRGGGGGMCLAEMGEATVMVCVWRRWERRRSWYGSDTI
ncbi:hypothetical protein Droror1_Dr00025190 [Drosera rotundifolia]